MNRMILRNSHWFGSFFSLFKKICTLVRSQFNQLESVFGKFLPKIGIHRNVSRSLKCDVIVSRACQVIVAISIHKKFVIKMSFKANLRRKILWKEVAATATATAPVCCNNNNNNNTSIYLIFVNLFHYLLICVILSHVCRILHAEWTNSKI